MAGLYSRVDQRVWGDARFRALSAAAPNAQTLWLYLLTGPHGSPVPGLMRLGKAGLAEALAWSVPDLERCFSELESAGMARADWDARVVWLPNAIRHSPPDSSKNVTGWKKSLMTFPEAQIVREAIESMAAFFATLDNGESLTEAFATAMDFASRMPHAMPHAKGHPMPHAMPLPMQHEQKQEQEQEQAAIAAPVVLELIPREPVEKSAPKGRQPKKERPLSAISIELTETIRALTNVAYPPSSWDLLERALSRREITPDEARLVVNGAALDSWILGTKKLSPSLIFQAKRWPEFVAQAKAPKFTPVTARDGTERRVHSREEALAIE